MAGCQKKTKPAFCHPLTGSSFFISYHLSLPTPHSHSLVEPIDLFPFLLLCSSVWLFMPLNQPLWSNFSRSFLIDFWPRHTQNVHHLDQQVLLLVSYGIRNVSVWINSVCKQLYYVSWRVKNEKLSDIISHAMCSVSSFIKQLFNLQKQNHKVLTIRKLVNVKPVNVWCYCQRRKDNSKYC